MQTAKEMTRSFVTSTKSYSISRGKEIKKLNEKKQIWCKFPSEGKEEMSNARDSAAEEAKSFAQFPSAPPCIQPTLHLFVACVRENQTRNVAKVFNENAGKYFDWKISTKTGSFHRVTGFKALSTILLDLHYFSNYKYPPK